MSDRDWDRAFTVFMSVRNQVVVKDKTQGQDAARHSRPSAGTGRALGGGAVLKKTRRRRALSRSPGSGGEPRPVAISYHAGERRVARTLAILPATTMFTQADTIR